MSKTTILFELKQIWMIEWHSQNTIYILWKYFFKNYSTDALHPIPQSFTILQKRMAI